MDLTPTNEGAFLQILLDPNDPSGMGDQTFELSAYDPTTGTSTSNPLQQINAVTSYLDLSNVYGSTPEVAAALRTFSGGQLKTSPGNMLPYNNLNYFTQAQLNALNMANSSQELPSADLFAAGDVRANENVELTALQTLFVRNHNLIASELQQDNPHDFGYSTWTDEELYQEAPRSTSPRNSTSPTHSICRICSGPTHSLPTTAIIPRSIRPSPRSFPPWPSASATAC